MLVTLYEHRYYFIRTTTDFIKDRTKLYFKPVTNIRKLIKLLSNDDISKLANLSNSISKIETNTEGDIYVEFKNNVILAVNGSTVAINKGELIVDYKHGAFAPNFNVMELVNEKNIGESIIRLVDKRKKSEEEKLHQLFKEKIKTMKFKEIK